MRRGCGSFEQGASCNASRSALHRRSRARAQDALARFTAKHGTDWEKLPEKVVFQLNDTHPTIGVAELQRLLVDVHHVPWETAKDLTIKCLAFTNHTVMPEALERWPVTVMAQLLPRHVQIIDRLDTEWCVRRILCAWGTGCAGAAAAADPSPRADLAYSPSPGLHDPPWLSTVGGVHYGDAAPAGTTSCARSSRTCRPRSSRPRSRGCPSSRRTRRVRAAPAAPVASVCP